MSTPITRQSERPQLLRYAARVLGDVELQADRSWDYAEAHVLEVIDGDGTGWIVKHCYRDRVFDRETKALADWAPAVGPDLAPRLYVYDAQSRTFVMDRLPGTAGVASTPDTHRQAGVLIRRLHNQPRNWLVDDAKTVRLIDFGKAEIDAWIRDIDRMYFAEWVHHPDLEDAFFEGYGSPLSDEDRERLRCLGAATSITGRLWAREHHSPAFEAQLTNITVMLKSGIR